MTFLPHPDGPEGPADCCFCCLLMSIAVVVSVIEDVYGDSLPALSVCLIVVQWERVTRNSGSAVQARIQGHLASEQLA